MSDANKLPFSVAANFNTRDETGKRLQEQVDKPFCIAIVGNFSGRKDDPDSTRIRDRQFIAIDRYNYDDVLASMGLKLSLQIVPDSDQRVDIAVQSIKDFLPDQLYRNVALFGQLRDMRERLNNPQTFQQALQEYDLQAGQDEVTGLPDRQVDEQLQPMPVDESAPDTKDENLLESILDETAKHSQQDDFVEKESRQMVDALVRQLVAGKSRSVSRDARQDEMVASVDDTISEQMQAILHHPQFQAMESLWRGLQFMVKRIRSNKVKLYLLDVSREELDADVDVDDIVQSSLYRHFCDAQAGDINWNLIVGDYRFAANIDDILALSQFGLIAHQAGAHFIAAADESLVGCASFSNMPKVDDWGLDVSPAVEEGWALLRKSPLAHNISLALPRFLLRAPYGKKTTSTKAFRFEEMSDPPEHNDYLWGNPAFLKAEQIARAFVDCGWDIRYDNVMTTEDLPVHYYQQGGRTVAKPCAEIALTDAGASKMIARGLVPLWSVKDSDRVHSGDFHSIAE